MLIVRAWTDYYDSAMGLGTDKTVVYNRVTSIAPAPNKVKDRDIHDIIERLPPKRVSSENIMQGKVLLLCGEVIPFIEITLDGKDYHFYSADKATDFINAKGVSLSGYYFWWRRHYVDSLKGIKNFLEDKTFSGLTRLHHIHKCPIIVCQYSYKDDFITLNPNLKSIGYHTQKDPYTLFQTLYMFLSGVLGTPEKQPRPVSDEIIAADHGHDDPYSFRNVPGKKRGRNR